MNSALLFLSLALLANPAQVPPPKNPQTPPVIYPHPIDGGSVLCTYEIGDLLRRCSGKPEVLQGLDELGYVGEHDAEAEKELRRQRTAAIDFLTAIIVQEVHPATKNSDWTLRITPSGTVVLHAMPAQQAWVKDFLLRIRSREPLVELESTWIEGPKGAFQRMGFSSATSATVIESKDRERVLALEKDDVRFEISTRAELTLHPLAFGYESVSEHLAYIKSYKLETVQPGNVQIADPEIEFVNEGMRIEALAVVVDGNKVAIDLTASSTAVHRPIPTKNLRLVPEVSTEVTIAMPEIERKSILARCTLAPEGTVAFCAPVAGKNDRELLILVRAHAKSAAESGDPPKQATPPR